MTDETLQVTNSTTTNQYNALAYIAEHGGAAEVDGRTLNSLLRKGLVVELGGEGSYGVTEEGLRILDPEAKIEGASIEPTGGGPGLKAAPLPPPNAPENLDYVPEYATKSKAHARMVKLARDFHRNSPEMGAAAITAQIAGRCSTMDITAPSLEMVQTWLDSSE